MRAGRKIKANVAKNKKKGGLSLYSVILLHAGVHAHLRVGGISAQSRA